MSSESVSFLCPNCGVKTNHIIVWVTKPTGFEQDKHQRQKEFITGFIKGWFMGPFSAAMDDLERHLICEQCGCKSIEG